MHTSQDKTTFNNIQRRNQLGFSKLRNQDQLKSNWIESKLTFHSNVDVTGASAGAAAPASAAATIVAAIRI